MNLQSDEIVNKMLEVIKRFDDTAYNKPWNGKKQRLVAKMHYGHDRDPGMAYRAEITNSKDKIYWWIGLKCPFYRKYADLIDQIDDKAWRAKYDETRIIFYSADEFFEFVNKCLGSVDDINTPLPPKGISADGTVVICPKCETKFKRAERCPDCGQLIKYPAE